MPTGNWLDISTSETLSTWHDSTKSDLKEYLQKPEGTQWVELKSTYDQSLTINYSVASNGKQYVNYRRPLSIGH